MISRRAAGLGIRKATGVAAAAGLLALAVVWLAGPRNWAGPIAVCAFAFLAVFFMSHERLRSFTFTAWVFAFVAAALAYPAAFGVWFGFDLALLIVPLIQVIMFGMGTTLSGADFQRVLVMPRPVFIGLALQFSVMPLAGLALAKLFGFSPEVAAGVVLIGSCPGGVASNLMAYLARGDVALSVTMTACSTLLSPVLTPFLMKALAGQFIEIVFLEMMMSILNMIIVPVLAGLIANRILYSPSEWANRSAPLVWIAAAGLAASAALLWVRPEWFGRWGSVRPGLLLGFALLGLVALAKWLVNVVWKRPEKWMDRALPLVSMFGICFIIAIITARSSEKLMTVGVALLGASVLHNSIGYVLGYWLARVMRLDETICRTIAFEVGMQNGGMASGLAMNVLKSPQAALAPAIFGPWMNISGSVLASWWKQKPVRPVPEGMTVI